MERLNSNNPIKRVKTRLRAIERRIVTIRRDCELKPGNQPFHSNLKKVRLNRDTELIIENPPEKKEWSSRPSSDKAKPGEKAPSTHTKRTPREEPPGTKAPEKHSENKSKVKPTTRKPDLSSLLKDPEFITGKTAGPFIDALENPELTNIMAMAKIAAKIKQVRKKDWLVEIAKKNPKKIIRYDRFPMQARTALKFRKLKQMIKKSFPSRGIYVTSTMGGKHMSPAHPAGRAVDFVIDRLTKKESYKVAALAKKAGFYVYNEYVYGSRYKTGDHMHIEL